MNCSLPDGPAGPVLVICVSRGRRGARVALVGDLDVTAVSCLQSWAREFTAGRLPGVVCLDLSELRFVDVAGARALAESCALLRRWCSCVELAGWPQALERVAGLTAIQLPGQPGRPAAAAPGEVARDTGQPARSPTAAAPDLSVTATARYAALSPGQGQPDTTSGGKAPGVRARRLRGRAE